MLNVFAPLRGSYVKRHIMRSDIYFRPLTGIILAAAVPAGLGCDFRPLTGIIY